MNSGKEAFSKPSRALRVTDLIHSDVGWIANCVSSLYVSSVQQNDECSIPHCPNRPTHRLQNCVDCRLRIRISPEVTLSEFVLDVVRIRFLEDRRRCVLNSNTDYGVENTSGVIYTFRQSSIEYSGYHDFLSSSGSLFKIN